MTTDTETHDDESTTDYRERIGCVLATWRATLRDAARTVRRTLDDWRPRL